MAERRSMETALNLSQDKVAFIKAGLAEGGQPDDQRATKQPRVDTSPRSPDFDEGRLRRQPNNDSAPFAQAPAKSAEVDEILVPITTRLKRSTFQAIRRLSLEQKLNDGELDSQQRIIQLAVEEWLARNC
jgi:hypothetical protein